MKQMKLKRADSDKKKSGAKNCYCFFTFLLCAQNNCLIVTVLSSTNNIILCILVEIFDWMPSKNDGHASYLRSLLILTG